MVSTQFSLKVYALQPKIVNNSLKPLFCGSRSFKVIDVGTTGKLVGITFHGLQLRRFDAIQQCDRRTDRQTEASAVTKTALALHDVACNNQVIEVMKRRRETVGANGCLLKLIFFTIN